MIKTPGIFDAYESTIVGENASTFIPDVGIRMICGWTAEGTAVWFAETDIVKGSRRDYRVLADSLQVMVNQLRKFVGTS